MKKLLTLLVFTLNLLLLFFPSKTVLAQDIGNCDCRVSCPTDQYPYCVKGVSLDYFLVLFARGEGNPAYPEYGDCAYNFEPFTPTPFPPGFTPTVTPTPPFPTPTRGIGRCDCRVNCSLNPFYYCIEGVRYDDCDTGLFMCWEGDRSDPNNIGDCTYTYEPLATSTPTVPPIPTLGAIVWSELYGSVYPTRGAFGTIGSSLTLGAIVSALLTYIFPLAGILLLLYLIYGGFQFMTSGGDPGKAEVAKRIITYAIIGFVVVFLAFWIVQIVAKTLGLQDIEQTFVPQPTPTQPPQAAQPVSVPPDFPGVCSTYCFNNNMTCVDQCTTGAPGFTYVLTCSNGLTRHVNDSNFPGGNACANANVNYICASQGLTQNSYCCCQ